MVKVGELYFTTTLSKALEYRRHLGGTYTVRPITPDVLEQLDAQDRALMKFVIVPAPVLLLREKCAYCGTVRNVATMTIGGPGELPFCNEACLDADLDDQFERFRMPEAP